MKIRVSQFVAWSVMLMVAAGVSLAKTDFPETTDDGLTKVKSKNADVLYVKEGATLEGYKRIALLEPYVAFRKDWMKDQNQNRIRDLSNRVSEKDMDRIKKELAAEFMRVFTKELSEEGGYEITEESASDVLVLRPAIVNLDVNAPDLRNASMMRSYVSSAGEMTLYLELHDGVTGDIIAKAIDERDDNRAGGGQRANSVTNRSAADRILKIWANSMRKALDEANEIKN